MLTGSLCTGYGGLDAAVNQVFGGDLAWVSDVDAGSCAVLEHRVSDVPNIGDFTVTDWGSLPAVDLLCGGVPCQPFSAAGKRKGTADERHLWPYMASGIAVQRPALVIVENVQGLVSRGLSVVLADFAALGYDAAWTVIAAADAGAPHRRKRLFILAVRDGLDALESFPATILRDGAWTDPGTGLFGPVPFTGRVPEHGVMVAGQVHVRPLPTLLPTPAAHDSGDTPENHLRKKPGRQQVTSLQVITDYGLLETGGMLRTPTAQLAINGGSQHPDKRKAGGHGPTLADEVEHVIQPGATVSPGLPTPAARDYRSGKSNIMDRNARPLNEVLEHLPTPAATDGQGGPRAVPEVRTSRGADHGPRLRDVAPTIPTPQASDYKGSGATQGRDRDGQPRSIGDADLPEAVELLPSPRATGEQDDDGDLEAVVTSMAGRRRKDRATDGQMIMPGTTVAAARYLALLTETAEAWGKYAPGIARWEQVLGRPAPSPTQPGRDGKPRLSPLAVEWLMGLPMGWVCDVPGLSRSQMLKLLGNGVVPRQGAVALALLAQLLPARILASLTAPSRRLVAAG